MTICKCRYMCLCVCVCVFVLYTGLLVGSFTCGRIHKHFIVFRDRKFINISIIRIYWYYDQTWYNGSLQQQLNESYFVTE